MLGLMHCVFYRCNMNGANSLDDADRTPLGYCPLCRRKLEWNVACDPDKRAAGLTQFYRRHGLEKQLVKAAS